MSADQIAEIVPAVRETLAAGPGLCATLQVSGAAKNWVQFSGGVVNAAYPHSVEPSNLLSKLGSCVLEEWEANKFITVRLELDEARAIAKWIDRYFDQVCGCDPDYSIDVTLEVL